MPQSKTSLTTFPKLSRGASPPWGHPTPPSCKQLHALNTTLLISWRQPPPHRPTIISSKGKRKRPRGGQPSVRAKPDELRWWV